MLPRIMKKLGYEQFAKYSESEKSSYRSRDEIKVLKC